MILYYHPVSTASRPILHFCAEAGIDFEPIIVDLMTGEHFKQPYAAVNPNCMVPVIDDEGFVLTESSTILKYLADKFESPAYPRSLQTRARINELMDWFNSNLYREYGYHLIYPQLLPHHRRQPEVTNRATVEWGRVQSNILLQTLNDHYLGRGNTCLCGNSVTLADYFGAAILSLGEIIGIDFSGYPNIDRWLKVIKAMPSWIAINEAHDGFVASMKEKTFVTLEQPALTATV